jgi:hypothetical protein
VIRKFIQIAPLLVVLLSGCTESSATPETGSDIERDETSVSYAETSYAETRPDHTRFEDVLAEYQDSNLRLARVAAPLRLKNKSLCPNTRRDPGFTIHKLEDYPEPMRPMAEALLGVKPGGLYVRAVRPNTSAEKARLEAGDQILGVNGNVISPKPLMETYNRAVLRNGFESVLSKVKIRTANGQEYVARIRPDTACDIPVKVIFSNDINGHTDGTDVLITSALMRSVPDDTNLALVIAHEMAHVIAGHAEMFPTQELELEADRMALVLMARAGYDVEAAVAYWKDAAHPHEGGTKSESTHPTTRQRYQNFSKELKRIQKSESTEALSFE